MSFADRVPPHIRRIPVYKSENPAEEIERLQFQAASFSTGKRQSKIGRPTKKQRRELDDFLGED